MLCDKLEDYRMLLFNTLPLYQLGSSIKIVNHSWKCYKTQTFSEEAQLEKPTVQRKDKDKQTKEFEAAGPVRRH